jgi:hypothetical protein
LDVFEYLLSVGSLSVIWLGDEPLDGGTSVGIVSVVSAGFISLICSGNEPLDGSASVGIVSVVSEG